MNNIIPRNFKKLIVKMNIKTNTNDIGDILHISKNEYNDYIATNIKTGEKASVFINMLRTPEITTILETIK